MIAEETNVVKPNLSVAKIGKRWFWCIFGWSGEALAKGYAPTESEADTAAATAAAKMGTAIVRTHRHYARQFHHIECERARQSRGADRARKATAEVVYHHVYDVSDQDPNGWTVHTHRIVKRTPKFVYVERDCFGTSEYELDGVDMLDVLALNRRKLDNWGEAEHRRKSGFFSRCDSRGIPGAEPAVEP